jgi:hypothetical protein
LVGIHMISLFIVPLLFKEPVGVVGPGCVRVGDLMEFS